ncbi:hypothetical protein [Paraburkholderia sp. D1E]|uniref:hypothetical protein n=1 Tax=Paraburkholderia sp. D1E TaxID=3461398 RepID=UPI0040463F7B
MALKKTILIDSIGVPAAFHVVDNVNVSRSSNITAVMVTSYYTEETCKAGKQPLGMATSIALVGIPDEGVDCFRYAEQMLAQKVPEDGANEPTLYPGSQNRYLFAGAEIAN